MSRDWKQWAGQVVNGSFPLRQYLGGSDHSAVFLTERRGRDPQRAAIKLIAVDPGNSARQLASWEWAAKLAHPHLLQLFETGSCQLDNVVLLYVVMEFAEENLAQILPQRALTPEEARDLLEPALDALAFLHGKSLVHGRLKPSNILATQDLLKLSSDSLVRTDDSAGGVAKMVVAYPSVYDAPEVASGKLSPASDSWSLGMTLMEALTQRLPAHEGIAEPMPETVAAPFMGIAHCCLRRDPARRCSAADIAARLRGNMSSPLSRPSSKIQGPSTIRIPAESGKWRYILPVAAVALVAGAILVGPKLLNNQSAPQPTTSIAGDQSNQPSLSSSHSQETEAPAAVKASGVTKSSTHRRGKADQPAVASQPSESVPVTSNAPGADAPVGTSGQRPAVQQVMPTVSKSARDTVHGTIKVRVKVEVDPSGNVQTASLVSPGPSKYFARQAMQAAQQWKFAPPQGQDPRTWIVRFGFKRSGTEAVLESATP